MTDSTFLHLPSVVSYTLCFLLIDIAPVDQWYVEISMFHGFEALNAKAQLLETLKGTLLDETRGEGDVFEISRKKLNTVLTELAISHHVTLFIHMCMFVLVS